MRFKNQNLINSIDAKVAQFYDSLPFASDAMKVSITVPAKNEENYLLKTLEALNNQVNHQGRKLDYNLFEVIVLCHNCTDATYEKAFQYKTANEDLNLHIVELNSKIINNIGGARRVLMQLSAQRLLHDDAWIVSTDADSVSSPHWIHTILHQAS